MLEPIPLLRRVFRLSFAALLLTSAGCDDDCGSAGRFTERNGLDIIVVCGDFPTRTPTPTPTPTPQG